MDKNKELFVFLGPTLSQKRARSELDACYLPPAGQGDVYLAARQRPFAIGIVDGYFERVPSIWHKEILWALSHGIHVLGAASMGALRAVELQPFGMKGIGKIFDDFRRGVINDDDEVAVAHADEDHRFKALSEPMVNIRATLNAAEQEGILPRAVGQQLITLAKRTFYPERSFSSLISQARQAGIESNSLHMLQHFVTSHRIDQKGEDAVELVRALGELRAAGQRPPPVAFSLAHTDAWDRFLEWAKSQSPRSSRQNE